MGLANRTPSELCRTMIPLPSALVRISPELPISAPFPAQRPAPTPTSPLGSCSVHFQASSRDQPHASRAPRRQSTNQALVRSGLSSPRLLVSYMDSKNRAQTVRPSFRCTFWFGLAPESTSSWAIFTSMLGSSRSEWNGTLIGVTLLGRSA